MKTSEFQGEITKENNDESIQHKSDLFNILRNWRKSKARELKIEPYMVFQNKTLEELSKSHITQKNQLLNIYGIGKTKFVKYGDEIFKILMNFYSSAGIKTSELEPNRNIGKESENVEFEISKNGFESKVGHREFLIDTELKNILKYDHTSIELKNRKYLDVNVDKETYLKSKAYLKGKLSEIVLRYTLKNSGYIVIRGDKFLIGYLKNKPEIFRDQNQAKRVSDCVKLCEDNFIGLPDFFAYNNKEEFFFEVKSNKAGLNENQYNTFSEINKIIPIIIAHVIMKFSYKSVGISLEQYSNRLVEKTEE